jgi:hypothetical protein
VLKSSYALGYAGTTEQITIANCVVSGYDVGTVVGGTFGRDVPAAPDGDGPTGRIKLGTESNGGFRAIAITNVIFARCRGIALETVDGGTLEDVTINNVIMREISSAPIFLRLGARLRGPATAPGRLRRISISDVSVHGADPRYPSMIVGLPGTIDARHPAGMGVLHPACHRRSAGQRRHPIRGARYPRRSVARRSSIHSRRCARQRAPLAEHRGPFAPTRWVRTLSVCVLTIGDIGAIVLSTP